MLKYFNLLIVIILFSSCKKELEKYPLDTLTSEQAFETEQNLQLYVNSFYPMLPSAQSVYGEGGGAIQNYYLLGNILSDNTVWDQNNPYLNTGFTSRTAQGWSWGALRSFNYFLEHYNEANISPERKKHFAGIARFFRAWFYYDKVNMFGDVPWYGHVLTSADPDLYRARDPRTLVMDSVLADIDFAVQHVSSVKSPTSTSITKWAALALKSRICLYEGTYRKYHTELGLQNTADKWLKEAENAAAELMTNGPYQVHNTGKPNSDYRALFISSSPVTSEVILARAFSEGLKVYHNATGFYSNFGKYQPSLVKRFVNTYLKIDGTRFTDIPNFNSIEFQNEVLNRDARLAQTIRTPSYRRSDGSVAPPYMAAAAVSGYQVLKFSLDNPAYDLNGQSANAIPLIRYAEVLLNYAEAKAELGTFTAADWTNTIGLLRKRAGIADISMPATLDPYMQANYYPEITSIPLMEIRRERAIELAVEGFRYTDLKRWKKAKLLEKEKDGIYVPAIGQLLDLNSDGKPDVSFVTATPPNPVAGVYYFRINNGIAKLSEDTKGRLLYGLNIIRSFPDFKYLAPLPYNDLLMNKNLEQNPGWDKP
ncbi:MAG TPA: RagB/SusD family nutrient uptake outer membrane protein [Sphingobacteriaceae bacterium]